MEKKEFNVSEVLSIMLQTSSKELFDLCNTRFSGLYEGDKANDNHTQLKLLEVPKLEPKPKKVLREITIPEYCVYDENTFYIVQGRRYVSIPFEDIGKKNTLEIKFEKGFPVDWIRRLIDDILAFHVTGFGMSFIHAACLTGDKKELIIPAWRGTGKTSLALSLLQSGYFEYKAEDQFFINRNGDCFIYNDACHVDSKHMKAFPQIKNKYNSPLYAIRTLIASMLLPILPPINVAFEFARRIVLKLLSPKVFVKIGDFLPEMRISHEKGKKPIVIQVITQPDIDKASVSKVDNEVVGDSILGGMQYERLDLYPYYYAWVYATGKRNEYIDNVNIIERDIIQSALKDARCYVINVPIGYDWNKNMENVYSLINN